jgi:hypothetical protein
MTTTLAKQTVEQQVFKENIQRWKQQKMEFNNADSYRLRMECQLHITSIKRARDKTLRPALAVYANNVEH